MCRVGTSFVLSNVTAVVGEDELYCLQSAFPLLYMLDNSADYPRYADGRVQTADVAALMHI